MPTMSTKPVPDVALEDECCFPCWKSLPDHVLLHIFSYLDAASLHKTGLSCKGWLRVAFDELLWKDLFYRHWQISRSIQMAPGKYSWIQEYKRLLYHTPLVESEVLKQHADQVLHVSFSHNGKMFATCSKDGFIRVWDSNYPTSLKYKADMRKFTWKYTQFSQFNATDTLLLVSGVHFGSLSTSGEIAVFSLEGEFVMQSRVMNKPYDVFGTWYNDCYLLSGNLHWTGHLNSCSQIWLNKAYQETNSEEESVVMKLFKFSNINASSIRTIMVAKCLNKEEEVASPNEMQLTEGGSTDQQDVNSALIGEEAANQEADCIMGEDLNPDKEIQVKIEHSDKPSGSGENVKRKPMKNVQSIQVYENGSFITKFLEVDDEECQPNKLNGTIRYNNDYRLAEEPTLSRDMSESDVGEQGNSGNLSRSGTSERSLNNMAENGNSNMDLGSVSSGSFSSSPDIEDSQTLTDIDLDQGHCQAQGQTRKVKFDINTVSPLSESDEERSDSLDQIDKISNPSESVVKINECMDVIDTKDNENDIVDESSNHNVQSNREVSDSLNIASKRILHGQQQEQGDIFRNPSCDLQSAASGSDVGLVKTGKPDNEDVEAKLAFCCVDYKKTKRAPIRAQMNPDSSPVAGSLRSCAGPSICSTKQSEEILDIQFNDSDSTDIHTDCMPVKQKCNFQSSTNEIESVISQTKTAQVRPVQHKPKSTPTELKLSKNNKHKLGGDKYLIFTKGSKTYTPHQIGIKRIKPFKAFNADGSQLLPNVAENTQNSQNADQGPAQGESYDDVDHLIDMHGHIIGMALSSDQRYLYVNSRPWPKNYEIENPLYPPPIAQEIDIHVIDLLRMREVGTMHRSHKAYTSNDECFFIFLDVCEEYVASGAEDKHGYLWDRHYGLCLHKYLHSDVVNSVAFNPSDPEVLVTVSDDFSIKIWRSHSREKEVVKAFNKEHCIRLKHVQAIMDDTEEYIDTDVQENAEESAT